MKCSFKMRLRRISVLILLLQFVPFVRAQQPSATPAVESVLSALRANLGVYNATLPKLTCDEEVTSLYTHKGQVKRSLVEDSQIQVVSVEKDGHSSYKEERTLRSMNGEPVKPGKRYKVPFFNVSDSFGATFTNILSSDGAPCIEYRLVPEVIANGKKLLGLQFWLKPNYQQIGAACSQWKDRGIVMTLGLDPTSLQLERLHKDEPHVDSYGLGKLFGSRYDHFIATIDYGLVPLGPKSYLVPSKVHAIWTKTPPGPDQGSYDATYRNCHLYKSHSTMIFDPTAEPLTEEPPQASH